MTTTTPENARAPFTVRIPGQPCWADGISDAFDALNERDNANRVCGHGHEVIDADCAIVADEDEWDDDADRAFVGGWDLDD